MPYPELVGAADNRRSTTLHKHCANPEGVLRQVQHYGAAKCHPALTLAAYFDTLCTFAQPDAVGF
jgi:hypothetical protein